MSKKATQIIRAVPSSHSIGLALRKVWWGASFACFILLGGSFSEAALIQPIWGPWIFPLFILSLALGIWPYKKLVQKQYFPDEIHLFSEGILGVYRRRGGSILIPISAIYKIEQTEKALICTMQEETIVLEHLSNKQQQHVLAFYRDSLNT